MTEKPSPEKLASAPEIPKGAKIAPNIHAVIRMWSGVTFLVTFFRHTNRIWKSAASRPPTRNAYTNSMPPSVFATPRLLLNPTVPQIQPSAMQMAANSTLNHTTNHTQFQTHLPIFSLFFVQGPTAFMPTAIAKPENGSSAPNVAHSSTY